MVKSQRPKILDDWIHVVLKFQGCFRFSSLLLQDEQCYSCFTTYFDCDQSSCKVTSISCSFELFYATSVFLEV